MLPRIIALIGVLLITGCAGYIKDTPEDAPHATLHFPESSGWLHNQAVNPLVINGQPANGGRWSGREYRVPPGEVGLFLAIEVSRSVQGEAAFQFTAKAGENYSILAHNGTNDVIVEVKDAKGTVVSTTHGRLHVRPAPQPAFVPIFIPIK